MTHTRDVSRQAHESAADRRARLDAVRHAFRGLHRADPVLDLDGRAGSRRRVYLDSTATTLMPDLVSAGLGDYFDSASANSHTIVHRAGRATTEAIEASRRAVGALVGKHPERDVVLLEGNGATGAINFLSRALFPPELRAICKRAHGKDADDLAAALGRADPTLRERIERMRERPLVVISLLEHHSNILPWIEAVGRHHVRVVGTTPDGRLDVEHYERILQKEGHRVRLCALSGASNVTGVLTPVHDLAERAHAVGAQIMVDAAQLAPHRPIRMSRGGAGDLDYLVVSGHKMYAPGSRGVLVGPLEGIGCGCVGDVGGGMVEYVSRSDFRVKQEITAREEAGTPNIPGTIALGMAARMLSRIGMDVVAAEESALVEYALGRLLAIDGLRVYGPTEPHARVGVISVNVPGLRHAITAAYLDDVHAIAVRNDCFCAHPYVKALLECPDEVEARHQAALDAGDRSQFPGMVRISLGLYTTRDDLDAACEALTAAVRDKDRIAERYAVDLQGNPRRTDRPMPEPVFDLDRAVDRWFG